MILSGSLHLFAIKNFQVSYPHDLILRLDPKAGEESNRHTPSKAGTAPQRHCCVTHPLHFHPRAAAPPQLQVMFSHLLLSFFPIPFATNHIHSEFVRAGEVEAPALRQKLELRRRDTVAPPVLSISTLKLQLLLPNSKLCSASSSFPSSPSRSPPTTSTRSSFVPKRSEHQQTGHEPHKSSHASMQSRWNAWLTTCFIVLFGI